MATAEKAPAKSRARKRTTVAFSEAENERAKALAEAQGISVGELLRRSVDTQADEAGVGRFQIPEVGWKWCAKDFERFCKELTLPNGERFRLEAHIRFVIREVFVAGRVELLVMLPKGNYKTTLFAALAVFHLLTVGNANCFIGAADKIQADEMYRFASHFASTHALAEERVLVRNSTRELRSTTDQGFVRVLASDDSRVGGKRQGFNPTLALIDELHAHDNSNLYTDMRSGLFKNDGLLVTITTAGHDEESVLGELRRNFLDRGEVELGLTLTPTGKPKKAKGGKGRLTIARLGTNVLLEWACHPDDDLTKPAIIKLANPAKNVTIKSIKDALEAPGLTPQQVARYRANVWAQADDAVIGEAAWDGLDDGSTIPEGAPRFVIVDYARKRDGSAVLELWRDPEREVVVPKAHVWAVKRKEVGRVQPAAHELLEAQTIRQSLVRDHIRSIRDAGAEVLGVIYDPHLFDPEELSDEGFLMIEFPQSNERLVPASKAFYEAVHDERIRHDGDRVLRSHVISAAAKDVSGGEGWRFSKARSKKLIDACICFVMGIEEANKPAVSGGFEW